MKRLWLLVPLLLTTGLVYAVYSLRIEQVSVTGVRSLSPREIIEASGLLPGERILWERLSAAERAIERLPAVANAVAERSLPSTVVIHVREREPLARLDGARDLVVDAEGLAFSAGEASVRPVLYGWRGRKSAGARVDERSRTFLKAFADFPAQLRDQGRKIRVGRTLVLTLAGGTEVRFGGLDDLELKARAAIAVLKAERGRKLQYIDVASPTVAVSREKAPPTPTPTTPVQSHPPSSQDTPAPAPAPASTGRPTPGGSPPVGASAPNVDGA